MDVQSRNSEAFKVVENADNCVHITMPATPTGSMELSDEELSNAAGGSVYDGIHNCTPFCLF
jgi:mersacidin/lichenicidin family type 2 lantibiotic